MTHEIKIRKEFVESILSGDKTFEIRLNDRGYQKGDYVKFKTVDKLDVFCMSDLDDKLYEITYVISGWGIKEGYVVFGIKCLTSTPEGKIAADDEDLLHSSPIPH